jgi:hypothetical protein
VAATARLRVTGPVAIGAIAQARPTAPRVAAILRRVVVPTAPRSVTAAATRRAVAAAATPRSGTYHPAGLLACSPPAGRRAWVDGAEALSPLKGPKAGLEFAANVSGITISLKGACERKVHLRRASYIS